MARAHRPTARAVLVLVPVVLPLVLVAGTLPVDAGTDPSSPVTYRPPTDAPVIDRFRPPAHRFGPGNRGLEYGTRPGDVVRASAPGRVVFAGPVAGSRHVTLRHADGLRTSYSFLASIDVRLGDEVAGGDPVGTAGGPFHFSVRAGTDYLDPESVLSDDPPRARLIPVEEGGWSLARERAALWEIVTEAVGAGWSALWQRTPAWLHYLQELPLSSRLVATVAGVVRRRLELRRCTPASEATPAAPSERRIVVLVAGLSSSSDSGSIDDLDVEALGYAPEDVVRFSYGGGQVAVGAADDPSWGSSFPDLPSSTYEAADTEQDLRLSGARLLDLLHRVAAEAPGTPIDVIAHSQGGMVTRVALAQAMARGWPVTLANVITLGSPHGGADLATAAVAVSADGGGATALRAAARQLELELDPTARSISQLAETSNLVHQLRGVPLPPGVRVRSIAARGDLVVPVPRTRWPGAEHAVVSVDGSDDHTALPASPAAHREVALALAGAPPTCEPLLDTVADQLAGELTSWLEDLAGAGLSGAAALG